MFRELYYWDCGCGSYWEGNISLPYAIHVPNIEDRMMLEKILDEDGFQCAVSENEHPVMLVNFTLKRYGRVVQGQEAELNQINKEMIQREQFLNDIYLRYKEDSSFRDEVCNNYVESARIMLEISEEELHKISTQEKPVEYHRKFTIESIARYKKQMADASHRQQKGESDTSKTHVSTSPEIVRIGAVRFLQWPDNSRNQSYPHTFTVGKRADESYYFRNEYTELPNEFHLYPLTYPKKLFLKAKALVETIIAEPKLKNRGWAKETWVFKVDYDDGSHQEHEFVDMEIHLPFSEYNDFLAYGGFFGEHDLTLHYPADLNIDDVRGEIVAGWVPFNRFYEHRVKQIVGYDDGIDAKLTVNMDGSIVIDKIILGRILENGHALVTIDANGMIQNTGGIPYVQILKKHSVRILTAGMVIED